MKKFLWYIFAAVCMVAAVVSCKKEDGIEEENLVATLTQAELVDAAAAAYAAWEDNTTIPATLTVGQTTLTLPQYQYAICKLLSNIADGDRTDVKVLGFKEANKPGNDSYDKKEIAVKGGPKIAEGTEDIVDIAKRMVATMTEKLTVPNSTLITRTGEKAIAFSTNRATVTILRTIAAYKADGSLPGTVSTEYLSAASSLKGFAEQFVKILDIWQKTVGTVSADGSHCTDNNSAWQNVHFVPIPHSGGAYADGKDQYDAKYQPYFTVTIDGKQYTSAQTWGIALRGIVDMITTEGSAKKQVNRNPFEHTMGNGAPLTEPLPPIYDYDIWGQYPWYESTKDGPAINLSEFSPYLIARCATWFLTRQEALGKIGNYMFFCTDPEEGLVEEGVDGFVSSMRMWLIAARFYKYLLDNNIKENVYDAVKDVKFDTDLYGVEMPDIDVANKELSIDSNGTEVTLTITAKKAWTVEASEAWIHVNPASGEAGTAVEIKVSADANTGAAREGKLVVKGGNVVDGIEVTVKQSKYIAPSEATLKEFAEEFVNGLKVWEATVGTVESESEHLIEKGKAWENVHFIPIVPNPNCEYLSHEGNQYDPKYTPWVLTVAGKQYSSSQAWEIAIRGLMNMVTTEGEAFLTTMTDRNKAYTLGNNQSFSEAGMPNPSEANQWGKHPWYEGSDSDRIKYNGAEIESVDVNFMVKVGAWHVVRSFIPAGSNDPLGMVGNFQQFGTSASTLKLDGYDGLISPMREMLVLMRIYKYILDNNIDQNVYDAIKDQKFDFDLYNQGVAPKQLTIKDFAKEYVKILDIWQNTTGEIVMHPDVPDETVANAHYVPPTTTITVGNKVYNTADMFETALRSYLLIRGYNGLDTEKYGKNSIPALDGGALKMSETPIPETHSYTWGSSPWNETKGNGGHLVMGNDANGEHCKVKVDILDNWAMRSLNFQHGQTITNLCGYAGGQLAGYYGCFCSQRALLTYAFFFKHMLDNNLDKGTEVSDDTIIRSELLGDEGPKVATIKDFAKEYVKILDIWQNTTGEIVMHPDVPDETVANAHFVPKTTTITVGGKVYNTADMFETALRSYLLIRGYNGLDTEKYGKNSIPALDGGALKMSETPIPETHSYTWGSAPWNETKGNGGHLVLGNDANGQHCKVKVDILDNWAMRSLNFQHGKDITNLCGYAGGQLAGYYGCFCSQRALLTYAFFFKHMLDNNLDKGTEVAADTIIRSELLGDE